MEGGIKCHHSYYGMVIDPSGALLGMFAKTFPSRALFTSIHKTTNPHMGVCLLLT